MVNCLLLVSGSVAAIKTWQLRAALLAVLPADSHVRVVATSSAMHFLSSDATAKETAQLQSDDGAPPSTTAAPTAVLTDADEWAAWSNRGDPVVHIELRKWADVACVAPLCANTLAKIATGICDNLLTSVMRAWEWRTKPVVLAPAMNTTMWEHPLTAPQLALIQSWSPMCVVVPPVAKTLVCGDTGVGAMAACQAIADAVARVAAASSVS